MTQCITFVSAIMLVASILVDAQESHWEMLFDGKTKTGWHTYLTNQPIEWEVNDGILFTPGGKGDIVTDQDYKNFELELEWMIERGGNSGIFYHVQEDAKYPRIHHTGPEFQIIDDVNYPVLLLENQKTGSCSDVLPPKHLNSNPPGSWNKTTIKVIDGHVEHWLNGIKILDFNMNSRKWKKEVKNSKFKDFDYAKVRGGKIGLQDHGDPVYYKYIRIKNL